MEKHRNKKRLTVWLPKQLYADLWMNKISCNEAITDFVVSAIREKLRRKKQ